MDYRKDSEYDLIDRSKLVPDLGDASIEDGTKPVHYSQDVIKNAPRIDARPKRHDSPHNTVLEYIWSRESEYYSGKHSSQSLESVLTTMYALYNSAWAVGEITWDQMFYSYSDFVAKYLKIR